MRVCCCTQDGCNRPSVSPFLPKINNTIVSTDGSDLWQNMTQPGIGSSSSTRFPLKLIAILSTVGALVLAVPAVLILRCYWKRSRDEAEYSYSGLTTALGESAEEDDEPLLEM